MNTRLALIALTGTALIAHSGHAALTQLDSTSFDYQYEMDVNPSGQDLDSAGSATDWFPNVAGGAIIPQTYTGGVAVSNQGAAEVLFRTDFGGSITRQSFPGDFTIEVSVHVNSDGNGGAGSAGYFGIALQTPGETNSFAMVIDAGEINISGGSTIATADNTDGFHTFRIANEGDDYFVWRDGVLLNADESSPFAPSNGSFNTGGAWFVGDYSGSIGGNWEVDYIRADNGGAFAPVPEPTSLALLGLGGLLIARRRRG